MHTITHEATPSSTLTISQRWATALRALDPNLPADDPATEDLRHGVSALQWATAAGVAPELQARAAAEVLGIPYDDDLTRHAPSVVFVERIPIDFARQHGLIGLAVDPVPSTLTRSASKEGSLAGTQDTANCKLAADSVPTADCAQATNDKGPMTNDKGPTPNPQSAIRNPQSPVSVALATLDAWPQLDVVGRFLDRPIEPLFAPHEQIRAAINRAYQERLGQAQALIDTLDQRQVLAEVSELEGREDLLDVAGRAPVIKLVNLMILEAVKGRASDVHVQPYEDRLVVRMRIDGVLSDAFDVAKTLQEEVVSRIKVLGRMNIAEKRLPQDGGSTVQVGDRLVDLRIASLPTSFGERVVIRLLDKTTRLRSLESLGMDAATFARFRELANLEHGLILVTGPTGSGKSTTLYSVLQEIDAKRHNVVTLEDPTDRRFVPFHAQALDLDHQSGSNRRSKSTMSPFPPMGRKSPPADRRGQARRHPSLLRHRTALRQRHLGQAVGQKTRTGPHHPPPRPITNARANGDLFRPVALPLRFAALAIVACLDVVAATMFFRAHRYRALAARCHEQQAEVFRRALPGQTVPAGIVSRLESEYGKLTASKSAPLPGTSSSALALLHHLLAGLPQDVGYRLFEIRLEDGRIELDGEVATHGDADRIAAALRGHELQVEPPRSQQLPNQAVGVRLSASLAPLVTTKPGRVR